MPLFFHKKEWVIQKTRFILTNTVPCSHEEWTIFVSIVEQTLPLLQRAELFSSIEIKIEQQEAEDSENVETAAWCSTEEFLRNEYIIHVLKPEIIDLEVRKTIRESILHEFTHLVQFKKQQLALLLVKYSKLLEKKEKQLKECQEKEYIFHFRVSLTILTQDLPMEGLAEYCRKNKQEPVSITHDHARLLANELQSVVEDIVIKLKNFQINKHIPLVPLTHFDRVCSDVTYKIGYHCILTIIEGWREEYQRTGLPFDPLTFIDHLLEVNRRAFYTLYEQKCAVLRIQPVFSFDSGKGIFDYKTWATKVDALILKKK